MRHIVILREEDWYGRRDQDKETRFEVENDTDYLAIQRVVRALGKQI